MTSPNSCPSDDTVTIFENAKDSRSTFKFHSFRFQRLDKSSTVWLHCEVQVCDSDRLPCRPVSLRPLGPQLLLFIGSKVIVGCFTGFPVGRREGFGCSTPSGHWGESVSSSVH